MDLKFAETERGFKVVEFDDRNSRATVKLQESSLATEEYLWVAIKDNKTDIVKIAHIGHDDTVALQAILLHFVETGELPTKEQFEEEIKGDKNAESN
jgi:hypothetical protein